ncbi:MAG: hypothetical protein KR126chlam5_00570 [Candidatus Anoxychlamydiales bacterium]|nr:hypothetical protein [Candidatus Anoxychlamydiales bacterium]
MQFQTKALYNFLRFTSCHNKSLKVKKWQIEDLRVLKENKLFESLKNLGFNLNKEYFLKYANEADSPEDLVDLLAAEKEGESKDRIYLVLFELYRRFFSEKRCISIFADELDHRIFLYDSDELYNDELLQNSLANLKNILDSNVDFGVDQKEAFKGLLQYLAHDLENFLFDYISDQIDAKNEVYALELIDGYYPYISKTLWFDFLKAKLKALDDISSSNEIIEKVLSNLKLKPNIHLQFRILKFMVGLGDRNLFMKTFKQTAEHLKKENELKSILNILADFYIRLDRDDLEKKILDIIDKRSKIKSDQSLKKQDINAILNILA